MSTELPSGFLALPSKSDRTVAALHDKLALLCLHTLLVLPPARATPISGAFGRLRDWLEASARGPDKAALLLALRQVDVRAPVLSLRAAMTGVEAALGDAVPALLLATARLSGRGGVRESLLWDVPIDRLVDPLQSRLYTFAPPARGVLANPSGLELRTRDGEHVLPLDAGDSTLPGVDASAPFHPICDGGPVLSECDTNPLFALEEHPDKQGNVVDLGGQAPERWCEALGEALSLIESALPELHRELVRTVERVVPVGYEPERHLSASYREAPGLIYLTLHPSPLTLAEAIIHEAQHGKLNALRWFDPILENGETTWSPSPVRPDLRPLSGVLLAVHAFVPVAALHLRLAELGHAVAQGPAFEARRAQVISANQHGLETVRALGRPTPLGRRVLDALEALHAATRTVAPSLASDATVSTLG